jgi:cyclase
MEEFVGDLSAHRVISVVVISALFLASHKSWGAPQPAAQSSTQANSQPKETKVAEGIYVFQSPDHGDIGVEGNAIAIINADDVFVFDANQTASDARAVIAAIRRITPKPVRYVANSHWHYDHWLGNAAYAEAFPGVEIIASEDARRIMENVIASYLAGIPVTEEQEKKRLGDLLQTGKNRKGDPLTDADRTRYEGIIKGNGEFAAESKTARPVLPTLTYDDRLTLFHGGREFRIMKFVGNTPGDTALYLPNEKILITGDLLVYPIQYAFNSRPRQWIESLKALDRLDAKIIIPGHGEPQNDKQYLRLVISAIEEVVSQVHDAAMKGMTLAQTQKTVNIDSIRMQFTHDDSRRNEEFQAYFLTPMIDRAYKEATGE